MKFLNNLGVEKTVQLDFKAQTQVVPSDNLSRKLYWDDFNRTLSLEMGNGVIQQIGKERLVDVRNATASPIPNGTLVMITGALGASGRLTIAPAISDGSVSSFDILGITTEDITSGSDGIVTTFGLINGINTTGSAVGETWTAGDTLYPHPTILGALTNVLPQAPHLKAIVGRVNFVDATTGNIFIRLQYGSYLGGDNNVQFSDLSDNDLIVYSEATGLWENVKLFDIQINASQVNVADAGGYYTETQVESVLQEIGAENVVRDRYLLNQMSTGVTEYTGMTINTVDNTKFDIGPVVGYVVNNETDPDAPTITRVEFAGQTGITPPYLLTAEQTTVYLTAAGTLFYTNAVSGTAKQRREMLLLGRIVHTDKTIIRAIENWPTVEIAVGSQLRDLWRAIGPVNESVYVYPNGANLQLSLNGGGLHYGGLNYTNDRYNPTRLTIPSQTVLTFGYRTQLGTVVPDVTSVKPNYYDLNGVITEITGLYKKSTNQRVFLTRSGAVRIQYGQTLYSSFGEALAGIASEPFNIAPSLASNAILIGIITLENNVTALNNTAAVRFTGVSKLGELGGGGGGGGAAVNAVDVAVTDVGNYYTSSNAEDIFQEIGYDLAHIVDQNTKTVVAAGTSIGISDSYDSLTDTHTYTVSHADTSSATSIASDNSNGVVIQDMTLTLDGFGHATAASVNTVDLDNRYYTETEIDTTLTTYQLRSEKGAANGYASLDSNGLVPNTQLPSYVDDVLEYANLASFPETGETGKIYVALDTNKTYRWSGSTYVYITSGAVDSVGGYTGVVTAQNVFDTVKTLDGTGSGLDADLLDGQHGSYYATAANLTTHTDNVVKHNNYAVADGTNSYTVTLSPAPLSYTAGMVVSFKAANANTGAVTLSCNGLLEKPVKKSVSSELASGDIVAGQVITVIYDGENFQIVSGSGGSGSGGGLVYQTPSVGDIKITAALDDNHLWCDGQAVSRITYADLFEVIGTTYGPGDGVTTFNLPDFNDGGLFYKSAICFRNFREVLNSSAFNPFLDADSIATVKSYFGTTPPDGWLWTQGQALSRVSYAGLFAVIGETYGVGDGVTTFNLPTIGTNYIIKVSNLLNNKVAALPTALTLTTYSETTVALTQGSAGTSVLADFDASKYMSAELVLQITQGAKFEMTKLHVISNGTDTYLEEYGRLGIATSVTFSTAISGSLVQIKVTSTTNPATIKGKITRILK